MFHFVFYLWCNLRRLWLPASLFRNSLTYMFIDWTLCECCLLVLAGRFAMLLVCFFIACQLHRIEGCYCCVCIFPGLYSSVPLWSHCGWLRGIISVHLAGGDGCAVETTAGRKDCRRWEAACEEKGEETQGRSKVRGRTVLFQAKVEVYK